MRSRYEGMQTVMQELGLSGCLFLCLLSIAEEQSARKFDLIDTIQLCLDKKVIADDFTVLDSEKLLYLLTGKKWKRTITSKLPDIVPVQMYTIEKYARDEEHTHFRRRYFDTLQKHLGWRRVGYYLYEWR